MTNQEAKVKAIRQAYGNLWETVKEHTSPQGWCRLKIAYAHDDNPDIDIYHKYVDQDDFRWRPKVLRGICNNNGWNRIEGFDTLPKDSGTYTVLGKSGEIEEFDYSKNVNNYTWLEYFTHWRPTTEIPKPIY